MVIRLGRAMLFGMALILSFPYHAIAQKLRGSTRAIQPMESYFDCADQHVQIFNDNTRFSISSGGLWKVFTQGKSYDSLSGWEYDTSITKKDQRVYMISHAEIRSPGFHASSDYGYVLDLRQLNLSSIKKGEEILIGQCRQRAQPWNPFLQ